MIPSPKNAFTLAGALRGYVAFLARHDLGIAAGAFVLFVLAILVASGLKLRSDFGELLPQDDPDVLQLKDIEDKIGGAANLIVAVQGPDPRANRRFAEAVAKNLQPLIGTDLRAIDYRADASRAFFEHNKALYLDLVDLERIDDDLRKLIAGKKNPAFLSFADAVKGEVDDDPAKDLNRLKARLEKSEREESFPSGYYESNDKTLLAVIAWTSSSGTGDSSGYRIRDDVQQIIDSTNPSSFGPVRTQLTGDIISAIDEHDALRSDIAWVSLLCVALVLTVVVVYFRSIIALGYIFFPTLLGVSMALAITELAIGYLNTNTAFLGSIIIGNGINFGIILSARYQSERFAHPQGRAKDAMTAAIAATLRPTFAAALAAGIAYGSLGATTFRGFRQFGFVGGIGMLFCWLSAYSYCPALILLFERLRKRVYPPPWSFAGPVVGLAALLLRRRTFLLGVVALVTAVAAGLVARLVRDPFEYDFAKLRNQQSRKHGVGELYVRVGKMFPQDLAPVGIALLRTTGDAATFGDAVLKKDCVAGLSRAGATFSSDRQQLTEECARRVAAGEATGGLLAKVSTVFSYLPKDQDVKLAVIATIRRRLADPAVALLSENERRKIDRWLPPADLHALTSADLPDSISRQFREKDGTVGRVALLFPVRVWANWDGHNLIRLADVMKNVALPSGVTASAAGQTTLFAAMLKSMAHDGRIATGIALTAVAVTVIVVFRSVRISALVLLSLAVGVVWMGAAARVLGLKLNFLNFVALPITFGIGVDYAVNVFARIANEPAERHARAIAETGSAVALCSLTTIIGYSSLLIASNGALVSFGELANLGEAGCLLAALLLAPVVSSCHGTQKSGKREL